MAADWVDRALPLVRGLRSDLSLREWRSYCAPFLDRADSASGLECVLDEKDYLIGLAGYEARPDIRHGRVLMVDPFIAVDLYGRNFAAQMLLARVDTLAGSLGCRAIHIAYETADGLVTHRRGNTFDRLFDKGYRADSLRLCKGVTPAV
ncbi:MAG: hypothetical protein JJ878_02035 [Alphaproteobacteria bacterium]|nr:hypothetical protein [Alphaproteobacteria bacterium]MBO6861389.1 hypothetical protein [Alphaproteobacteria bacterium]